MKKSAIARDKTNAFVIVHSLRTRQIVPITHKLTIKPNTATSTKYVMRTGRLYGNTIVVLAFGGLVLALSKRFKQREKLPKRQGNTLLELLSSLSAVKLN